MMLLLHISISLIALLTVAASEDCWWTGCQANNWAVVGCAQYGRLEKTRESCTDGYKYECCSVDSVITEAPVTEDPLSCSGGYWTGCQPDSWAVVGCDHLNLTTASKRPCDGGNSYRCCPKTGKDTNGGNKPDPTEPEEVDDPVTEDPLSCSGGYWTGCQPNSWAVVGCEHLNMTTKARKPCEGGKEYLCCPRTGDEPSPDEDPSSSSAIDPKTNMSYLNLVKYLLSKNEEFANPERISCTDIDPDKSFQLQIGDYAIPVCNLCPKLNQLIYVNKMMKQDPEWQSEGIDFQLCFGSCIEKVSCVAFSHDNSTKSCYHFTSSRAGMASVAGFNTVIMTQPSGVVGPWMYSRNTMISGASNDSFTVSSFQECIGKAESSDVPNIVAVSYYFQAKLCKLFSNTGTHVFSLEAGYASAMRLSSIISDSDTASKFDIADEGLLIEQISNYSFLLGTCNFTDESKPFIGVYHRPQCKLNQLPGCIGDSPCKKCYFPEKLRKNDDPEGLEVCPDSFQSKYDKIMEKINKQLKECAATENCIAVIFDEFFNPELIKPDNVDKIKDESIVYIARYPKLSGSVLQRENFKILLSYKLERSSVQAENDFTTTRADTLGQCMVSCNKMAGCEKLSFNDGSKTCTMSTADGLLFPITTPGSKDVTAVKSKDASYSGMRYIYVPGSTITDENAAKFLLDKKECKSKCVDFCQNQCDMNESCEVVSLTQTGSSFSCSLYSSGNLTMEDDDKSMIFRKGEKINITENALNEMPAFTSSDVYGCYQDGDHDARQTQNSLSFVTPDGDDESKTRQKRGFFSAIGNFFKGIGKAVVNTAKGLVEGVKNVGQAVGDLVTGKPKQALERIKNVPIVGDVVKVGEGVGKLIKGDKKGALESFEDTTIGNTINTAKDVATGLIKGDFDGAAEAAGGLAVDLVGGRFGLKGVKGKGGKGGKGGKKGTVDNEIKNEKSKGDRKKRSTDDDKNTKQEKDQRNERKKACKAKKRQKRAAPKKRKPSSSTSSDDDDCDDDDDDFCPAMKFDKIIKESKSVFPCSRTKLSQTCKFECMPGFDEDPKYKAKCIKQGNDLKWDRQDLRCEPESCPASGIIVLKTPHPTSFNERKLTAMVIKFDKSRKIPEWSVAMFQGNEFGPRDYTHLALEESAGRHGSFLKHHCPSLKTSQANDNSYRKQKWERGHLTPAQAVRWSPKASRSVNLYINVAPQDENVNKQIWKFIESHTYCFAKKTRTIVATGTCSKTINTMNGVAVPSCFWKMICYRDENDNHQVVGFIADNSDLSTSDLKKRRKAAFTPKSQAEVGAQAGFTVSPFAAAAKDIVIGREELAIAPGVDAIDTANPLSCATVNSLPKEIFDEWDQAMDPDEKDSAVSALKRKLSAISIGSSSSSSGSRRRRAVKGKRDCKPCNSQELKGTVGALITSLTEADEASTDEEIGSTESTVASGKCGKRVVGYYPSWGNRKFSPRMAQRLTHVIFAFFETTASGDVKIGCVDPSHSSNCDDDAKLAGSRLKQMLSVASHFDHLNVMFAVGGWENSQYFSDIAASKEKRLVFIAAIIKAIRQYDFDGVDVDWEYPVTGGAKEGVPSDKQNYVTLLSELRAALDNLAKMDGRTKPFLLSIAGAAGQWTLDPGYDMKNLIKYLDFVNVMTYDFFGAWESKWGAYTGPPAPLYFGMPKGFSGKTNVAWTIKYYACRGQEPHKINMGVPFYGRYWENVGDPIIASDQMWRKANAVGGKFVGGAMKYSEVIGNISQPGFQQHFHEKTKSKYAFNPSSKVYIGYDDKETLGYKISFAQEKNVGGLMVWAIDQDDDDLTLLDLVAKADLCGNTNPKDINFKCLPTDEILWWIPENSDENTQGKCGPSAPPIHGRSPVCDPDDPGYSCCSKSGYCGSGDEFCKCEGCIDHGAEPDKILERSKITK